MENAVENTVINAAGDAGIESEDGEYMDEKNYVFKYYHSCKYNGWEETLQRELFSKIDEIKKSIQYDIDGRMHGQKLAVKIQMIGEVQDIKPVQKTMDEEIKVIKNKIKNLFDIPNQVYNPELIENGFDMFKDENNDFYRYEGDLLNEKPHGRGKATYIISRKWYQGEFKNGLYHGEGTLVALSSFTRQEGLEPAVMSNDIVFVKSGTWKNGYLFGDSVILHGERRGGEYENCNPLERQKKITTGNLRIISAGKSLKSGLNGYSFDYLMKDDIYRERVRKNNKLCNSGTMFIKKENKHIVLKQGANNPSIPKPHCSGHIIYENGEIYEGDLNTWNPYKMYRGSLYKCNGIKYSGGWTLDRWVGAPNPCGKSVFEKNCEQSIHYTNGDAYKGNLSYDGKFNTRGIYYEKGKGSVDRDVKSWQIKYKERKDGYNAKTFDIHGKSIVWENGKISNYLERSGPNHPRYERYNGEKIDYQAIAEQKSQEIYEERLKEIPLAIRQKLVSVEKENHEKLLFAFLKNPKKFNVLTKKKDLNNYLNERIIRMKNIANRGIKLYQDDIDSELQELIDLEMEKVSGVKDDGDKAGETDDNENTVVATNTKGKNKSKTEGKKKSKTKGKNKEKGKDKEADSRIPIPKYKLIVILYEYILTKKLFDKNYPMNILPNKKLKKALNIPDGVVLTHLNFPDYFKPFFA